MVEPFNESTLLQVIEEVMHTETIDHLSIEDQMLVIDLLTDSIKRYKGLETKKFLDEMDTHYRKNLSDL
mgnify:FL=1|tara:strand:+ start:68 stop:274 length:207 start_codon:yes stop_codon:yes gene_type:complete